MRLICFKSLTHTYWLQKGGGSGGRLCVCVRMCMCLRERERERGEMERERKHVHVKWKKNTSESKWVGHFVECNQTPEHSEIRSSHNFDCHALC